MIVDCISDLHGAYPDMREGDLLIVAGDFTGTGSFEEIVDFKDWLRENARRYKKIITVSGNHDNFMQQGLYMNRDHRSWVNAAFTYLEDTGTEFEGLKIWGSPWTLQFKDMNPKCKAFTLKTEKDLEEKFSLIPSDTDIIVTHSPPHGILDECVKGQYITNVGSPSLAKISYAIKPKLHVFGHIHEHGGLSMLSDMINFVNASYMDEWYRPVNKPVRIIL